MSKISGEVATLLKDRRALLWVCQRYDLRKGEEPHAYNLPAEEASLKYRREPNDVDSGIAAFYWEAIWLEGANSPLLTAIREESEKQPEDKRRLPVLLASERDATAEVSGQEFLPVAVLPGLLDEDAVHESRYGVLRQRARERVAWEIAGRLLGYQGRVLVVVGCENEEDLERLYEVLEDRPFTNLHLLLVLPASLRAPTAPNTPTVHFHYWHGIQTEFLKELAELGVPEAAEIPSWAIRVRNKTVDLHARDIERISRRFRILTEQDLRPPDSFGMDQLHEFLSGSLENWAAYGIGLPIERSYKSEPGRSLWEELRYALGKIEAVDSPILASTLKIPCQGGSGGTTLIRSVAYQAAREGYPSLILKPTQVDIDAEDLLAFSIAISEAALAVGITNMPPLVIVSDTEHANSVNLRKLPRSLGTHGRTAVILEAIPFDENEGHTEKRSNVWVRLPPLYARVQNDEVSRCARAFESVARDWSLPIEIQSTEQWEKYSKVTHWYAPSGPEQPSSLFWVALKFFLTEGMDFTDAERARDALAKWIFKRVDTVQDPDMKQVVLFVATLSSFRIVCPMWTVLRTVTGGTFSTKLLESLKQLQDIIEWELDRVEELNDQVLRFWHPSLSEEYLRREGVRTPKQKMDVLKPVLSSMSAGHKADVWLLECLAVNECTPRYEDRSGVEGWRLDVFEGIPPVMRDQNATILHHWGRCTYLFCDPDNSNSADLSDAQRRVFFETSIRRLERAAQLAADWEKQEHPGHVYNTLGTAYSRYAEFLEGNGDEAGSNKAWSNACMSFEKSIGLLPGDNVEALLAFGNRLFRRASRGDFDEKAAADMARALSLFDEADEILSDHPDPDPTWPDNLRIYRSQTLSRLDTAQGKAYIQQLKESDQPDLGYYCEARLIFQAQPDEVGLDRALAVFEEADCKDIDLGPRGLILRLMLLRFHPIHKYDFNELRDFHLKLERSSGYVPRSIDQFRHAVLCYQVGAHREGTERFRKLRESYRRRDNPAPRLRDFWRGAEAPDKPRRTTIRILRRITEWRAEGYVDDLQQNVPLRPRHFSPPPREGQVISCIIRFGAFGPLAIPPRFEDIGKKRTRSDDRQTR